MTTVRSIASNFSVQLIGKILAVLIGLISVAILTRSLGTSAFGEYTTTVTYLQMFGVVVDFGLTLTLIVMISKPGIDEERIVGNFFGLRLVSGFVMFSLAPLSVLLLPWSSTIQTAVLVGALAYFLMGGASMLVGVFQRHEAMWRAALAELVNRAVLLGLVALFAYTSPGVIEMVFAMVVANAVWLILMVQFASPFVRIRPLFEWSQWMLILTHSWPIAVSIIFNLLYLKGDILFLAYFRDQTEVGLYGAAYRILDVMTVLPTMLMGLVLPSLIAMWNTGHTKEFRARVARIFDVFALVVIPVVVGAQLTSTELMTLIAGSDFASAGSILTWLIFALVGVFLGTLYGHLVVAINKQRIMTWGYVFVAFVSIVGYLLYIPPYGIWGAVGVTLVSEALIALMTFMVVYRTSGSLPHLSTLLKAIVASAVMYLALVKLDVPVLIDLLIGVVVYATTLFALRAITIRDLHEVLPKRA
ncbi:MAG: flippase [Candidatus Uhrbacteria bacterium]|nr:flippase [Candidatus Uhrbacteria bacterium]